MRAWDALAEPEREAACEGDDVPELVGVPLSVLEPLLEGVCDIVPLRLVVWDGVPLRVAACVPELLRVTPGVKLGVTVEEGVKVREGEPLRVDVPEGL